MRANDRENAPRMLIIAVKELPSCRQHGFNGLEEFAMGDLATEMAEDASQSGSTRDYKSVSTATPAFQLPLAPPSPPHHPHGYRHCPKQRKSCPWGVSPPGLAAAPQSLAAASGVATGP